MSLTKFTKDLNIIANLDDEPNDVGGLSPAEAKAKFDEAGNSAQEFINDSLIPEIEEQMATKEEVQDIVLGQVPDGTITTEKLSTDLQDEVGKISDLQSQIDDCVKSADKATEEEAIAGTDDTKWMTPAKAMAITLQASKLKFLHKYTTAGAVSYVVPAGITRILVLMIGGGGSGGASSGPVANSSSRCIAHGGASGDVEAFICDVTPGNTITGVVGEGGASVSFSAINTGGSGNSGGTTSFNSVTANGGAGGFGANNDPTGNNRSGSISVKGQSSRYASPSTSVIPYSFQLASVLNSTDFFSAYRPLVYKYLMRVLANCSINGIPPFNVCAGGAAYMQYNTGTPLVFADTRPSLYNATTSLPVALNAAGNAISSKGTDPGCGGSGALAYSGTATSSAGCDGAIFIYEVRD